ncbi:hypothetical protein BA059_17210 [Mycolicibacterium sp. (ex Dasyatis americana)]|nr:hypothetical protein BA059_17210 [Mycolicibacterium sp. (ex Dasyatis americana)]
MAKREIEIGEVGRRVADNITATRTECGLTLVQLADLTEEHGRPLSLSALSLIAQKKRRVDVDDLAVIAAALDVSPSTLMGEAKMTDAEIDRLLFDRMTNVSKELRRKGVNRGNK